MLNLTKQQLDTRWNNLPIILREALYSPEKGEIIFEVGRENHLSDEKIGKIAGLAAYVLMGFLHSEDLGKEIKAALGLNQEIIDTIVKEINRKIFLPIRSEIDNAYALPLNVGEPEEVNVENEEVESASTLQIADIVSPEIKIRRAGTAGAGEAEPMKIEGEKIIFPGADSSGAADESAFAKATADKPVVLHKEVEGEQEKFKTGPQKSLGSFFSQLIGRKPVDYGVGGREEKEEISKASVIEGIGEETKLPVAPVEFPLNYHDHEDFQFPEKISAKEELEVEKTGGKLQEEQPPAPLVAAEIPREVHYENELRTPIIPKENIVSKENTISIDALRGIEPQKISEEIIPPSSIEKNEITETEKAAAKKMNFVADSLPKETLSGKISGIFGKIFRLSSPRKRGSSDIVIPVKKEAQNDAGFPPARE